MKKNLAQRMRDRNAARRGVASAPALEIVQEEIIEEEDAAELEYQEKTTRQRRTKKQKLEVDEPSKPKRKYTRRKKDEN